MQTECLNRFLNRPKSGYKTQYRMAIKRTLADVVNLPVQIVSLILAAFVAAGLNINPDASAAEIVAAVKSVSLPLILTAVINLGSMVYLWIKTWKDNRPNFGAFITSRSWLISLAGIIIPALALIGIHIAPDDAAKLIDYGLAGNWQAFAGQAAMLLFAVIGTWLKPKLSATYVNPNLGAQKRA